VNVFGAVLLALVRFGPTEHLVEFLFSRIRLDDPQETEAWAREVYPDIRYSLYENADRFTDDTLSRIAAESVGHRSPDRSLPLPLIEALGDIEFSVGHIKLDRFERSLRRTSNEQEVQTSDLGSFLAAVGFKSHIAIAMEEAESHLRGTGAFDPKKAADLLRACMDEAHRAIVSELARIKQENYAGKDKDAERRAYMRRAGFISPPEEQFIGAIYSLISGEASHKLDAPRETVLVLQTTVYNFLILLLKRLANCKNSQQVASEATLVERGSLGHER
jgi:hypothetical protein